MKTCCTPDTGMPKVFEFEFGVDDKDKAAQAVGLTIPANSLFSAKLKVVTAFDSDTSDELTVGNAGGTVKLVDGEDLQSTGVVDCEDGWTDEDVVLVWTIASVGTPKATHGRAKLAIEIKPLS